MWPPLRPYMYSDLYPNSHLHAIRTGAVVKYPFICIGFWRREAESVTSSGTEMSVMVRERGGPRELNQGCWCCGGTKMRVVTASLQLWPTWASAGTLSSSQPPPSLIPSFSFSLSLFLSSLPFTPSSAHLHFQIDFWEAPPSAYAQILLALFSHSFYHLTPLLSQKNCRDLDSERCRALPGKGYLRWLNGEEQKTMIRFPTRMQQHRRTQSLNWPKGEVCVCVSPSFISIHTQQRACQCPQSRDFSILNRWANTGFKAKVRGDTCKIELKEPSGRRREGRSKDEETEWIQWRN